jgi:hypothetical protein
MAVAEKLADLLKSEYQYNWTFVISVLNV